MTNEQDVAYGSYSEAYRAIHSALSTLTAPPMGHRITKLSFTWSLSGELETLKAYDGADLLFTLTFTWNPDDTLSEVVRS
ncbi:MAG: hypothetical protein ACQCN3_15685 [Candidatus Bathyarchaeia archaeon]